MQQPKFFYYKTAIKYIETNQTFPKTWNLELKRDRFKINKTKGKQNE